MLRLSGIQYENTNIISIPGNYFVKLALSVRHPVKMATRSGSRVGAE